MTDRNATLASDSASERMLENFGVTEATWREACREVPGFAISESPPTLREPSRLWPRTLRSIGLQVRY